MGNPVPHYGLDFCTIRVLISAIPMHIPDNSVYLPRRSFLRGLGACIEVMAGALASLARGAVHNPLRFVVRPPGESSLLGLMPSHRGGDSLPRS